MLMARIFSTSSPRRLSCLLAILRYVTFFFWFVEEIASAQRMRGDKDITISVNVDEDVVVESDKTHLANVLNKLFVSDIKVCHFFLLVIGCVIIEQGIVGGISDCNRGFQFMS